MTIGDSQAGKRIEITGVVQGVGFRPFVYNLALHHGLRGWVRNTSVGIEIEASGPANALRCFVLELVSQAPPRAHIERVMVTDVAPDGHERFEILPSRVMPDAYQLVSPDIATCPDCLHELFDPQDRRYGYPFINCTNCGPRFTVIEDIPYDRPLTTMRRFHMCPDCQAEYDDPTNRRFHAQPNACPVCGPHLVLVRAPDSPAGGPVPLATSDHDAICQAARLLEGGAVVAIKGLGGFQLACDATNQAAVALLRERKHRPHKPFAVMLPSTEDLPRYVRVSAEELSLLTSPGSPIVLLPWQEDTNTAPGVAPNNRYLGVMLPYTPLHHLLLREVKRPLVMTSGNLSEEPIAQDNEEALVRLRPLADAFLLHNRGISSRYDDSVWFVPLPGQPQPVRRARGYAPMPIRLPFSTERILACGAELKNTFCLTRDEHAFVSQHIGDMENLETLEHFQNTVALYERLFRTRPTALACDLHPDYLATRYAQDRARADDLPLIMVQHHHAHIASCLADNAWPATNAPVLGVAMDGTGYGRDGQVWGGEFLIADYASCERFGHLQYYPLPGGDAAIHRPGRIALAYLLHGLGRIPDLPFVASMPQSEIATVHRMIERRINTPWTSSCGRLFDAVSALLGLCCEASYEGQAAMELEAVAGEIRSDEDSAYHIEIIPRDGAHVVLLDALLGAVTRDIQAQRPVAAVSAAFHNSVACMIVSMAQLARQERGVGVLALSGGCFQNRQLLRLTVNGLDMAGFTVLTHHQVPCNDGGLSLGQAMVANTLVGGDH